MKKILLISGILFFVLVNISFAQGKVTPFEWPAPVNPDELNQIGEENATTSASSTSSFITGISILGFSPEIQQPDGSWKKIASIADIENGGEINVGPGSAMVIDFNDGSEVTLSNLSIFDIETRIFDEALNKIIETSNRTSNAIENQIYLIVGQLKGEIIKRNGQVFKVRTAEAAYAIRGTEFIVTRNPDEKITNLYLNEGIIDVDNLHGSTTELQAGETIAVDSSGQMTLGTLSQDEWNQLSKNIESATTSNQTSRSNSSWIGIIIGLLCVIGLGVFIYRKKSQK